MRNVVHVTPKIVDRVSGPPLSATDMYALQSAGWRDRGYVVEPVPTDGEDHPVNRRCPVCSVE